MAQMLTVGKFKAPTIQMPSAAPSLYGTGGFQPQRSPTQPKYPEATRPPDTYPPTPGQSVPQVSGVGAGVYDANPDAGYGTVYGPGSGTQGGAFGGDGNVDYSSLIGSSWEVAAAESMMASQMAQARASFQADLRSGFVDLGYDKPVDSASGLGDFSKYIDKNTIQAAIDNKYSAYAQIKQQETKANAVNAALLASSGLAVGGTATATAQDTLGQVEQARYEGLRNFLGQGRAGLTQLGSLKAQLAAGVLNARFAAAQRLAAMYPGGGSSGGGVGGWTPAGDTNYGFTMPGGNDVSNVDYVTGSENAGYELPPPSQFGLPWTPPRSPTVRPANYWDTHRPADRQ